MKSRSEGERGGDGHRARNRRGGEGETAHEGALRAGVRLRIPSGVVGPGLQVAAGEGERGAGDAAHAQLARIELIAHRDLAQLRVRPVLHVLLEDRAARLEVSTRYLL